MPGLLQAIRNTGRRVIPSVKQIGQGYADVKRLVGRGQEIFHVTKRFVESLKNVPELHGVAKEITGHHYFQKADQGLEKADRAIKHIDHFLESVR